MLFTISAVYTQIEYLVHLSRTLRIREIGRRFAHTAYIVSITVLGAT